MKRYHAILRCVFTVFTLTLLTAGCASLNVYHGMQDDKEGITYRLPRGFVVVTVPVTKKTYTATKLTQYAKETADPFKDLPIIELPDDLTKLSDGQTYARFTVETATVEYGTEPDPEKVYFVELNASASQNRNLKLTLNHLGTLIEGESQIQDKKLELAFATFDAGLRIAVSAAGAASEGGRSFTTLNADGEEAMQLRQELNEIGKRRRGWLAAHPDAKTSEYREAMAEFDARETAIISKFVKVSYDTFAANYEIRPSATGTIADGAFIPLLTIHPTKGIFIPQHEAVTEIIYPAAIPKRFKNDDKDAKDSTGIRIKVDRNTAYVVTPPTSESNEPTGLVYRIPAAVNITLDQYEGTDQLVRNLVARTIQIPQAGIVAALPRDAGLSPESSMSIALFEDTGALKSVHVESKSVNPELIRGFGTSTAESLDKYAAIRKAAAEAAAARPSRLARMTGHLKEILEFVDVAKSVSETGQVTPPMPMDGTE